MKRPSTLDLLSREHRFLWLLAGSLRLEANADVLLSAPLELRARRDALNQLANSRVLRHFVQEEQLLEAHARGVDPRLDPMLGQMKAGHRRLRAQLRSLLEAPTPHPRDFDAFGRRLEQHLGFEANELLPLLEELPPMARMNLDSALAVLAEHLDDELDEAKTTPGPEVQSADARLPGD
jgi:hypothetical protein